MDAHLFRAIVGKARDFLQGLIRQREMPPRPTLDINMAEFRSMQNLMIRVQSEARDIRRLQEDVLPDLKQQLTAITGIFKGKERKVLKGEARRKERTEKGAQGPFTADRADGERGRPQARHAARHRPGGGLPRRSDVYGGLPHGGVRCQPV